LKNKELLFGSIPPSGYPENVEKLWFHGDNEEKVKQNKTSFEQFSRVSYKFNSLGYRCSEFTEQASFRIVSIGCSYVFGLGIAQNDIFHEKFTQKLRKKLTSSVVNWNLGIVGASNDYIARMLHIAIPILDPHLVLINFTRFSRREYFSPLGTSLNYIPSYIPKDPVHKIIYSSFLDLSSEYDDQANFFRNYKSVAALLKDKTWLFSILSSNDIPKVYHFIDKTKYIDDFKLIDKARDNSHPGPDSNKILFEKYWLRFSELK
jgi:hypothetical protein